MTSVVPVPRSDGSTAGLVSVGIKVTNVNKMADRELPVLAGSAVVALALTSGGAALVSRRLRRQTRGLGPAEMTRLYDHHAAVLHSVREGVLIIDGDGRLVLANDEARRLLRLPADAEGRPMTDVGLPPPLAELLASGRVASDEVSMAGDRLLAVNLRPTDEHGGPAGTVATLRDTTELAALAGRAAEVRGRLLLLHAAGARIGTTLDVTRTAEELAEVVVPVSPTSPRSTSPSPCCTVRSRRCRSAPCWTCGVRLRQACAATTPSIRSEGSSGSFPPARRPWA